MKNEFFKEVKHKEKNDLFKDKEVKKIVKTGLIIAGSAFLLGSGIKLLKDVTD